MRHLEKISIGTFRGLRDLELNDLGKVNLLVGGNNSGKTTVLEAVDLQCHPIDILRFVTISKKRDSESVKLPTLESLQWMFPVRKTQDESSVYEMDDIVISCQYDGLLGKTVVSCKETKVFETNQNTSYAFPKAVRELLINSIRNLENKNSTDSDYEVINNYKPDFFVDGGSQQREVKAFDITFSYETSSLEMIDANTNQLTETFTITNSSMIKRGEKGSTTFPTELVTPIDHRSLPINAEAITQTILSGEDFKILELLQLFDEEIKEIKVLSPDGIISVPYIVHDRLGHAPISVFGDGVRRALTIATAVIKSRNGILLIDEIETAVHVRALKKVFAWLVSACEQYNVQLFASTHSLEAVDSIRSWYKRKKKEAGGLMDENDLVTFKLVSKGNKTKVKRMSVGELTEIRDDFGLDVR